MRLGQLAALGLLVGCAPDIAPGDPADGLFERRGDTWDAKSEGPCRLGTWGAIRGPQNAVHVRADGSDVDGDGSLQTPYATVDAALEHLREHGRGHGNARVRIAVGPGTFPTALRLDEDDPKLFIDGCSASETRLAPATAGTSIVEVVGNKHGQLRGVTLEGGRRALRVRDGGRFDVSDAVVEGSRHVGVLVQDHASRLTLHDTDVVATAPMFHRGWGIAVVGGAELTMEGGGVYESTGVGIFGDDADVTLVDVTVADTKVGGLQGEVGRGLHLQNGSRLDLTGGLFQNNTDAGVFLSQPEKATISGLVIDITSAGIVIDFPSTGLTGDGIVVWGGGEQVSLSDNLIRSSDRAAVLFDGADARIEGTATEGNGLVVQGSSIFAQEEAQVEGEDAHAVVDLEAILPINTRVLDIDSIKAE